MESLILSLVLQISVCVLFLSRLSYGIWHTACGFLPPGPSHVGLSASCHLFEVFSSLTQQVTSHLSPQWLTS